MRFDGHRFILYNRESMPALQGERIVALHAAEDGRLWIGTESAEVFRYDGQDFVQIPLPANTAVSKLMAIDADRDGRVWVIDREGRLIRTDDGLLVEGPQRTPKARGPTTFARDSATGELYLQHLGAVARVSGNQWTEVDLGGIDTDVACIAPARNGGLWMVVSGTLQHWSQGRWTGRRLKPPTGIFPNAAIAEGPDGTLALGSSSGGLVIVRPDGSVLAYDAARGLGDNWVRSLMADRDGGFWVGTAVAGLTAIQPSNFDVVPLPSDWDRSALKSVSPASSGGLWAGSEGGGLVRWRDGAWTAFAGKAGLSNNFVWSVVEDRSGRVWTGTWGGGLFVLNGDQFARVPGLDDPRDSIGATFIASDQSVWVGSTSGLWRIPPGARPVRLEGDPVLDRPDVRAITEAPGGSIWFGLRNGRLGEWSRGAVTIHDGVGRSADRHVYALHADERGVLWVGTVSSGLFRWHLGTAFAFGESHGIASSLVSFVTGQDSDLWVGTTRGILRLNRDDLDAAAAGALRSVRQTTLRLDSGGRAGYHAAGTQPPIARTDDGRFWIPTSKGLLWFDPSIAVTDSQPAPRIDRVLADGARVSFPAEPEPGAPILIQPGVERVEIRYTAAFLHAGEQLEFRHRLTPGNSPWVDGDEIRSASYHRLPPGNYVFEVSVSHHGAAALVALPFRILPRFTQRTSVRVAGYMAGCALVAGIAVSMVRQVNRRRLAEVERSRALERERTRIAQDIHDDMGSTLTQISLLAQTAHRNLSTPDQAAEALNNLYRTARDLTGKMDEIVWAVSPRHDNLESLVHYLTNFAQEHLSAAGIACRLDTPRDLPPSRSTPRPATTSSSPSAKPSTTR